jgi:glyoxylase-like metal-dependent hydrolase (beta-lactamase superfamily II)
MRIGDIEVVALSDGSAKMPPGYFPNADWGPHQDLLGDDGMLEIPFGCFLVRTSGPTVLVDCGIGPGDSPAFHGGDLPDELARAGVSPDQIDIVVTTHLHVDHTGWLARNGSPYFTNATVRFGHGDWDQFVTNGHPSDPTRQAMEVLDAAGRLEPITADGEIAPGISAIHTPGHTWGHTALVVSSQGQRALLLGDAVTCPVQLEEPEWQAMSDVDPALAARTREALWKELEGSDDVSVASHFPGLEFGRVLTGEGRRWFA